MMKKKDELKVMARLHEGDHILPDLRDELVKAMEEGTSKSVIDGSNLNKTTSKTQENHK